MTREEIVARIRELEATLADSGPAIDPLQSYSAHLAVSAERLRELSRLQVELKRLDTLA